MERKPHSTGGIVGAVVLLVVVPLGLYVGGYFALSEYQVGTVVGRVFASDGQAYAYWPLARLEAAVTRWEVLACGPTTYYSSRGDVLCRDSNGRWKRQ